MKRCISEWHQLKNGYWLKIKFIKCKWQTESCKDMWNVSIIVAKTRRKANDHSNSSVRSPKNLINKSTNIKGGIDSLMITLNSILQFEKILPEGSAIVIIGVEDQRAKVYSRLLRYGYSQTIWYDPSNYYKGESICYVKKIVNKNKC